MMARRRGTGKGDNSPERLAAAKAFHAAAIARLAARRAGRALPPLPIAPAPEPHRKTTPQQAYRNAARLTGEGDEA